jgi:hypothetical protein
MRICPECGAESSDRATHCTLCFKPFATESPSPAETVGSAAAYPDAAGLSDAPGYVEDYQQQAEIVPTMPVLGRHAGDATPGQAHDPGYAPGGSANLGPLDPLGAPAPSWMAAGVVPTSISLPDAFAAVFGDESLISKGIIAIILAITQIGSFAVSGYMIVYMGSVADGGSDLPSWLGDGGENGFLSYFLKGVVSYIVALIGAAPLLLSVFWAFNQAVMAKLHHTQVDAGTMVLVFLGVGLWMLAFLIYYPAALADYGLTDELRAFSPSRAFVHIVAKPSYFVAWGMGGALLLLPSLILQGGSALVPKSMAFVAGLVILIIQAGLAFAAGAVAAHLMGQWMSIVHGVPLVRREPGRSFT